MTLDDLKTLLDFHFWARDRVLQSAARLTPEQFTRSIESSFPSVRETLVHMYLADWGWYQLWQGISPTTTPTVDQFPDLDTLRSAWAVHETRMRAFLNSLGEDEVNRAIEFRRADGMTGSFPVAQMLQHVVNHGTYHRGQLTTMFRQLGVEPPGSMELIRYYSEQSRV
jgi:uncharacterized damage-inducible protein DinB